MQKILLKVAILPLAFMAGSALAVSSTTPIKPILTENLETITTTDDLQLNQPVIDKTDTLTAVEIQMLSEKIRHLWFDKHLVQTGVILVPTTGQQDIFNYCMNVAKKWRLGSRDKNNGLLMCFAMQDKKMYILTGTGIEKILPDALVKAIIDTEIVPNIKAGQVNKGINQGLDKIADKLRKNQDLIGVK